MFKKTVQDLQAAVKLPDSIMAALHAICQQARDSKQLYAGVDKQAAADGLRVLFCGATGTGKTIAVKWIAHELGRELLHIDLSALVSKYIGETEKNLERVLAEAQASGAILFFDEADVLLGKRSEVKDAHDRFANLDVNYLLQRIEEFNGIAILTTNRRENIDPAFLRRLRHVIDLP